MYQYILLIGIGILSVAGIWHIYKKSDSEDDIRKTVAIFLAIVIILCTVFMIYDTRTREIALMSGKQNRATLAVLLGISGGGYSPYLKDSWGGTDPDQDFDWDGVKNSYDQDSDNDGVNDAHEYATRYNPYQPDHGIEKIKVKWVDNQTLRIKCHSVKRALVSRITLYVDGIIRDEKKFTDIVEFTVQVNPKKQYTLEMKTEGVESKYANKMNNLYSYTVPPGVLGELGKWYGELENQVQGVIRNNPLFKAANDFQQVDGIFRSILLGIPLFIVVPLVGGIILLVLVNRWRKREGKPPLFGRKYEKGTIKVQLY
jgi:hypothetical protein